MEKEKKSQNITINVIKVPFTVETRICKHNRNGRPENMMKVLSTQLSYATMLNGIS